MTSRRKQMKPKSVKVESPSMSSNGEAMFDDEEPESKKRRIKEECESIGASSHRTNGEHVSLADSVLILARNAILGASEVGGASATSYDCQLCEEAFASISDLQSHTIRKHVPSTRQTSIPQLKCQHCDQSFPTFAAFAEHMREHLAEEETKPTTLKRKAEPAEPLCPVCGRRVKSNENRLMHILSHFESRRRSRRCAQCGLVVSNHQTLAQHCVERHLKLQYQCSICGHVVENQKDFREHSMSHSDEVTIFDCTACQIGFESLELLALHVQMIHDRDLIDFPRMQDAGDDAPENAVNSSPESVMLPQLMEQIANDKEPRIIHCSVCDEKCTGEEALDEHRLFSHCKVPKADHCAECQEPIRTADDFERHTRMHMRDLYMYCAVCRQSLRNESQLALHLNFHMSELMVQATTPSTSKDTKCHICNKTMTSQEQLNAHLLEHDSSRGCPHCPARFTLAHRLLAHVGMEHLEEPLQHTCNVCGQQFRFSIQFEHHILSHKGNENKSPEAQTNPSNAFSCPLCPKIFPSLSALHAHSHKGQSQKRCGICGLTFNTLSRYENHLRKHASTTSFTCQICGEGFSKRDDLDVHMRVHKGNLELGARNLLF